MGNTPKCEFCNLADCRWDEEHKDLFKIFLGKVLLGDLAVDATIYQNNLIVNADVDGNGMLNKSKNIKIKFCPMCGRRLQKN